MLIGVPREIKNHEYRIGLTPAGARELVANGHAVMVQHDGGKAIGLTNEMYQRAGAEIVGSAEEIFRRADMIIKVKEPQPVECAMLRAGQLLYTYLHLAPDPEQTRALLKSGATCIAYETVTDRKGGLPLLAPMSEVAGRMAIQAGARSLEKSQGGSGTLLGGVPGVMPGTNILRERGQFSQVYWRRVLPYIAWTFGGVTVGRGARSMSPYVLHQKSMGDSGFLSV